MPPHAHRQQHRLRRAGGIEAGSGVGDRLPSDAYLDNKGPGIALLDGGNRAQVAPTLASLNQYGNSVHLGGTLDAAPNTAHVVQLYQLVDISQYPGPGSSVPVTPALTVQTDAAGHAAFPLGDGSEGLCFAATATDPAGDTSAFSTALAVVLARANLTVTAAVSPAIVAVGDPSTVVVTARNGGPDTSTNTFARATIPAGLSLASGSVSREVSRSSPGRRAPPSVSSSATSRPGPRPWRRWRWSPRRPGGRPWGST